MACHCDRHFNGNGNADILWQNTNGTPAIWMMNGTSIVDAAVLPNPYSGLAGAGSPSDIAPW